MSTTDNEHTWDPFAPISTTPQGIYRPQRCASLGEAEHDGMPYYAMNHMDDVLRSKGLVEVGFKDGEWLLCSEADLIPFHVV